MLSLNLPKGKYVALAGVLLTALIGLQETGIVTGEAGRVLGYAVAVLGFVLGRRPGGDAESGGES